MNGRYERYMQFTESGSPIVPIPYIAEVLGISYTDAVCDLQEMAALGHLGSGAYINYKDRTLVLKNFKNESGRDGYYEDAEAIRRRIRERKAQRDGAYKSGSTDTSRGNAVKKGGFLTFVLAMTAAAFIMGGLSSIGEILDNFMYWGISWSGLSELFISLALAGGSGYLLYRRTVLLNRKSRIEKYRDIIGSRQSIEIDKLAEYTLIKPEKVKKDLEYAIKKDMLGTKAHFSSDRRRLLLSYEADTVKKEAPKRAETPSEPKKQSDTAVSDRYDAILREIRELNDAIADEEVSDKIYKIEDITAKIFKLVKEKPEKEEEIRTLMSYYLPTTLKLLRSYALFEKQGIKGENIDSARSDINRILDTLVQGFSQQLDKMFRADALDISTDIEVLESMMKKDGLSGGSAYQVAPDKESR